MVISNPGGSRRESRGSDSVLGKNERIKTDRENTFIHVACLLLSFQNGSMCACTE